MSIEIFQDKVIQRGYDVEMGSINSELFGNQHHLFDENGIANRQLKVFYLIRRCSRIDAPYVIFFNGGPGIGFTQHFFEHDGYKDFLPEYNIVFMDQRGTGLSEKPSENLLEYSYFSSRYICYDAEILRKTLLGEEGRWIVFGQSFGGHLVRKYLELYCKSAIIGISHGYGVCDNVLMKASIEKSLFEQVNMYFDQYPEDKQLFKDIKSSLTKDDSIGTTSRCLYGEDIVDIVAFYFGIYSFERIHEVFNKLEPSKLKDDFLKEIAYLGNLILDSGVLNSVIAYVDLIDGMTDCELYNQTEQLLDSMGISVDKELFSTIRLSKNLVSISNLITKMESFFENGVYKTDGVNIEILISELVTNNVLFYVIGSVGDSITPIIAIEEEEKMVRKYKDANKYRFVSSNGNHREWKDNPLLISNILKNI